MYSYQVSTIADPAIESIPAATRNCYFQHEFPLEMYQLYSQSGCVFECKMRLGQARTVGGCTPWFYPTKETNMCDPWQTQVSTSKLPQVITWIKYCSIAQIFLSAISDAGSGKACAHCLPDCISTTYTSAVSATPLRRHSITMHSPTLLIPFGERFFRDKVD